MVNAREKEGLTERFDRGGRVRAQSQRPAGSPVHLAVRAVAPTLSA